MTSEGGISITFLKTLPSSQILNVVVQIRYIFHLLSCNNGSLNSWYRRKNLSLQGSSGSSSGSNEEREKKLFKTFSIKFDWKN